MYRLTFIAILLLLCSSQKMLAQPRSNNNKPKRQAVNTSAPVSSQLPVNDTTESEREAYRKERDAKDDAFRDEQARQGRVVSSATERLFWVTTVYVLITAVYAFFAFLTLRQIGKQASSAKAQVEKMENTLEEIKRQRKILSTQAIAALSQARSIRESLIVTTQAAHQQLLALQGQWKAMDESLEETRKIVAQNERAVKAAEENAAAIMATAAPYFGIIRIAFSDFMVGRCPGLDIVFMNGGKTPAWHFYAMPVLVLGDTPESDTHWHFTPNSVNMAATFIPSERAQTFQFTTDFVYTEEWREAVESDSINLFVITTIEYRDHRNMRHPNHTFKCIWDRQAGILRDFETA